MKTRYTVLGFSLVLALAMAVPALGGPSNPASKAALTLQKVNTKAKNALSAADKAQGTANSALSTANAANAAAQAAQSAANAANANANTRIQSVTRRTNSTADDTDATKAVEILCASGEDVTGGGFEVGGTTPDDILVHESDQSSGAYGLTNGWQTAAVPISGTPTWLLTAIAECGVK